MDKLNGPTDANREETDDESRNLGESDRVEQQPIESFPFHGLCRGMLPVYMSGSRGT
jgi:hypothetical protein